MNQITSEELIDRILCADTTEIHAILDAAKERFSELFPNYELLTFSAPGSDPVGQMEELQKAISLLSSIK